MTSQPQQPTFYSNPVMIGLGYLWIIWWFLLPSDFNITSDLIGYWGSDQMDTISLHWAVFKPTAHFYPDGFNFWRLTPNILDHISFWPLQQTVSFPLNLNLWWIGILWLNAVSAHWMIRQGLGKHNTAWLVGVVYLLGEPMLREVNWGHAPQSMWFPALLSLGYWFKWESSGHRIHLRLSSLYGGLLGWTYLFYAPFLIVFMLPRLWHAKWTISAQWLLGIVLMLIPNLYWIWHISPEMTTIPTPPLINGQTLIDLHSNNWLWWYKSTPVDIANQMSVVVLIALGWILLFPRNNQSEKSFGIWGLLVGGLFLMGTNTPLFELFHSFPFLNRLQWPERFGLIALTGVVLLIAHLPKPMWFIPLILVEMPLRSENIPLHTVSLRPYECYRSLQQHNGAILSLPIKEGPDLYNLHGLFQQLHHRDLVNPFILPPFVSPPLQWEQQRMEPWLLQLDGEIPLSTLTMKALSDKNITSVIVDKHWVPTFQQQQIIQRLLPLLGKPQDLGCVYHWSTTYQSIEWNVQTTDTHLTQPMVHSIQVPLQ